jgi:hypothetical protein
MLTDQMIADLIYARNKIVTMHEWAGLESAVDAIDRVLMTIPAGQHPEVDALLGRCATQGWLKLTSA